MDWKPDLEERLKRHLHARPRIHPSAFVADTAWVDGDVTLGPDSSVWPQTVLRGDIERIVVGEGSNIQDGSVVHLADDLPALIGDYVTVGHGAVIHACTVENECLIGMRATVLDGAVIGAQSIVGAGAVVTKGTVVPPGSLVMGMPAKIIRPLTDEERAGLRPWAEKYVVVSRAHLAKRGK